MESFVRIPNFTKLVNLAQPSAQHQSVAAELQIQLRNVAKQWLRNVDSRMLTMGKRIEFSFKRFNPLRLIFEKQIVNIH
jgi:hypothetical protein